MDMQDEWPMLTDDDLRALPDTQDHLENLIPPGLTIVQGPKDGPQSTVALTLALMMASGAEWQGYEYDPQHVLYVTALGTWHVESVTRPWLQHHGLKSLPDTLTTTPYPINLVASPNNLIRDIRKSNKAYDMVIFDPLSAMIGLAKINNASNVKHLINNVSHIMHHLDCSVMLVSDVNTMGKSTPLIENAADADLRVLRQGSEITVEVHKMRDGQSGGHFRFSDDAGAIVPA